MHQRIKYVKVYSLSWNNNPGAVRNSFSRDLRRKNKKFLFNCIEIAVLVTVLLQEVLSSIGFQRQFSIISEKIMTIGAITERMSRGLVKLAQLVAK